MNNSTRKEVWQRTSEIGKELLKQIYGSETAFIHPKTIHPLEKWILQYDADPEANSTLIGARLGIAILADREDAMVELYFLFKELIELEARGFDLEYMIEMDRATYQRLFPQSDYSYQERFYNII